MSRKLRLSAIAVLLVQFAACQGCAESAGDSPQSVYHALAAAGRKQDYVEYCKLITPESVDQLAAGMLGAAEATTVTFEKKITPQSQSDQQRYERVVAVLAQHKIDPRRASAQPDISDQASGAEFLEALQSQQRSAVSSIKDKPAFIHDMMKAVETEESRQSMATAQQQPVPELTDIKIDGDRATGNFTYTHQGKELVIANRFRKIDGLWKMDLMPPSSEK